MENSAEISHTLSDLTVGSRLHVRSKKDWRMGVVSSFFENKVVIQICSPSGRTYRLRRTTETEIFYDGAIPILKIELEENWRENFTKYDLRW